MNDPVEHRLLARWMHTMPYVRKLLALITGKTERATLGLLEKYSSVLDLASQAGAEARAARQTLETAGDGAGVDGLVATTRERIAEERQRAVELERLGDQTRHQTSESEELIKRVNAIVTEIADIADRSKVISINLGIEAAKIGRMGAPFKVIAQHLRQLNTSTTEASQRAATLMSDFAAYQQRLVQEWQQQLIQSIASAGESAAITEETIGSLIAAISTVQEVFDRLIDRTLQSENAMAEILEHLQFQDITRQQVENVDAIIGDLVGATEEEGFHINQDDDDLIRQVEANMRSKFKVDDEMTVLKGGLP